jgi:ATP-dependent helicase/nuclease subunit B
LGYKKRMELPPVVAAAIQAGDTVIASTARAARALRRLHGEAQRHQDISAWKSADILDWDGWLHRGWQKLLRSGSETRVALTALQENQVWAGLIKPSIEGLRLISTLGVADLAQQAFSLLCEYRALTFLRGEGPGGPDVESFREWARGFTRTCEKEGWLSRSMLPLALHDAVLSGQVEAGKHLLLLGFDRTTPAQEYLLEALRQTGHIVENAEASDQPASEPPLLVEAEAKREEISSCALWLRSELAATAGNSTRPRIAVIVPAVASERPEIERIFREILAPEAVGIGERDAPLPFEFSLGVPLADVPAARAALLLLRWMHEGISQEQASWLMLSGFIAQDEDELSPMARFDARLRRKPMRQPNQDVGTLVRFLGESWEEARALGDLRHRLQKARRIVPRNELLTFMEWVSHAERILEAVHWPGAHPLESEDFQVGARWSQLLDNVAALAFDGSTVGFADFLEVLEREAARIIFAPESRDAPIQILGPLEAAGLTFDASWFLGADDQSWPATARPHPFLTRVMQRAHGMPHADASTDWELAQQVTTRLLRSSGKCVFSYTAQNADGACRPSTVIPLAERKKSMDLFASIRAAEDVETTVPERAEEPTAIRPWPAERDAGGADVLKQQAACPFQCFATKRLSAKPLDETDWGLDPRDRGSVLHTVLYGLWTELKTRDDLARARAAGLLDGMIQGHVEMALQQYGRHVGALPWTQAYLETEQQRICDLTREWLAYEAGRARFTFESGEEKISAAVGDLKLQIRVDRIDAVAGGRVIIDYKTGKVREDAWDGLRPDDPQLPIYAGYGQVTDLQGVLLAQVREGQLKFLGSVADGDAVIPGDKNLSKTPFTADTLTEWQSTLLALGEQFLAGEAQVDPKRYPKTCKYCALPGLCRIAESNRAAEEEGGDDDSID